MFIGAICCCLCIGHMQYGCTECCYISLWAYTCLISVFTILIIGFPVSVTGRLKNESEDKESDNQFEC